MPWNVQKINDGGVSSGPGAVGDTGHESFVCVYNDQQHFTYRDANGNIQDCWYDGRARWHLQQINDATGPAPPWPASTSPRRRRPPPPRATCSSASTTTSSTSPTSTPTATSRTAGTTARAPGTCSRSTAATARRCPGSAWPPTARRPRGDLFVSVYNDQQHFTYRDANGNLQDCWYDGSGQLAPAADQRAAAGADRGRRVHRHRRRRRGRGRPVRLRLQRPAPLRLPRRQRQHPGLLVRREHLEPAADQPRHGPTVAGEYVATDGPAAAGDLFVSVYDGQQHFSLPRRQRQHPGRVVRRRASGTCSRSTTGA